MSIAYPSTQPGFNLNEYDGSVSSPTDASATKRTHTLSNKLTSVLSSSYADSEIRDALRLLDLRGAQNAEDTRTNLKFDAQKGVIDANARIVDDFGKVAKQLQRVGALITILNQTCEHMKTHIQLARQDTAPILEEASTLFARKQESESKQQLLDAFNKHFLVSDDDLTTLTSSVEPINDHYFVVLARVKQIHKDCEILLGYENQRLGLELMEQTTKQLDAGYKKLYNWIQREFKGLDLEDPRTSGSIRRSLRALSERPTLFQNCLDFFGEAREVTLSEAFQKALTDSTIGSAKAIEFSTHDPLRYTGDMLAWVHSTTVSEKEALEGLFISDAEEISRGMSAGRTTEPWARLRRNRSIHNGDEEDDTVEDVPAFDGRAALNSLISRNMAAVAQTLHQRISLTIRNLTDPYSVYKAYNLLLFYEDIFMKLLGATPGTSTERNREQPQYRSQPAVSKDSNTVLETLATLQSQALTTFTGYIAEDVEAAPTYPERDLSPPTLLSTNLGLFASILRLRAPNLTKTEFTNLYSVLLTPVLNLCASIADKLTPPPIAPEHTSEEEESEDEATPTIETTMYKLNYLSAITRVLSELSSDQLLLEHVTPPLKHAESHAMSLSAQLSDLLTDLFLHTSTVDHLTAYLETANEQGISLLQQRSYLMNRLDESSTSLDAFLASALMDAQDDLAKLTDKTIAKRVVADAVENFCEEFEKAISLLGAVDDAWEKERERKDESGQKNGDDDKDDEDDDVYLREMYPRTVSEVRALLS